MEQLESLAQRYHRIAVGIVERIVKINKQVLVSNLFNS
jgi:hypothetical protein